MLKVKTKLGWDKIKGITVIADEDIKKGSCITYFDPDYDLIFEKTSFLHGNNSPFIRDLYSKYLSNPESVPENIKDALTKDYSGMLKAMDKKAKASRGQ